MSLAEHCPPKTIKRFQIVLLFPPWSFSCRTHFTFLHLIPTEFLATPHECHCTLTQFQSVHKQFQMPTISQLSSADSRILFSVRNSVKVQDPIRWVHSGVVVITRHQCRVLIPLQWNPRCRSAAAQYWTQTKRAAGIVGSLY